MKAILRECPFYRIICSSVINNKNGYCEFDEMHTICDGKLKHCKKLDTLRQYLMEREWMKIRKKDL